MKPSKTLVFWLAVLTLFSGGMAIWAGIKLQRMRQAPIAVPSDRIHENQLTPVLGRKVADFTLTERSGQPFPSSELAGRVWVASFFFASCPSTCRQQNGIIRDLFETYGQQDVKFLSITCDPEIDTPERLREYAGLFTSDKTGWLFLTGELPDIQRLGKDSFSLSVGPQTHSDRFVVIDKWGVTRGVFDWHDAKQLEELKRLVEELLGETSPPVDGADGNHANDGSHANAGGSPQWLKEFTLTERSGKKFHSTELAGQVWVASFFFTSCPSSCRQQNDLISRLHAEFGKQGVKFVNITCDPALDSPERLREYARLFNADDKEWLFLTGDLNYIRRVGAEKFGVPVAQQAHVDRLIAVDKSGEVRDLFNWHDPLEVDKLKELLPKLLAETEPPIAQDT